MKVLSTYYLAYREKSVYSTSQLDLTSFIEPHFFKLA